jgi:FKBP-type peptidyl-prolyl cis-trans isomerase
MSARASLAPLAVLGLVACSKLTEPPKPEPVQESAKAEIKLAGSASAAPAPTPTPTPTPTPAPPPPNPNAKVEMKDLVVGKGATAASGDTVRVHYVGKLTDGTEFDASRKRGDEGFEFPLGAGRVIKGWDQGVVGMKEGGKRKLTIPPELAYGERAMGKIPANSTLVFEVEMLKVTKKK